MKKLATCGIGLLLLTCVSTKAQIQRGNVMVGGDIANFNLGLDKGGNFAFRIEPKIAWFVKDNLAIGGYFIAGLSTAKGAGANIDYGLGTLARYYFNNAKINPVKHARFFAEGNVGIEGDNPAIGDNTNGLGLGIGPGLAYFITPSIGLEALLKYNGIVGFGTKPTSNNLNFSVGFQVYLPSKRFVTLKDELKNN